MSWNLEQAANDLERYVLRGELPAIDACKVLIDNARIDRTCHKELMTTEDYMGAEVEYFGCSWCGEYLSETDCYGLSDGPNYCENCGCKVDKSIVTDEATGEVIYLDGEKVVE